MQTSQSKTAHIAKHLMFWGVMAFLFVGYPLLAHNYFSAVMP